MSLLIIDRVSKSFRNKIVLDNVSLRIEKGERVALIGPNGAGKSTLLKIAMGLETADSGSVTTARSTKIGYLSQDLQDIAGAGSEGKTSAYYEQVSRLEQELRKLEQQMAVVQADEEAYQRLLNRYARLQAQYEAVDGYNIETNIKKHLYHLGLKMEALNTPLNKLSGGERMRVAVAQILLGSPDLLLLDEPTNHLDIRAIEWFEQFLRKFQGGVLLVSHDRYFLDRVATRTAELDNGKITARSGNYSSYLKHKEQLQEYLFNQQKTLRWTVKNMNRTIQGLKSRGKIKAAKSREKQVERLKTELGESLQKLRTQEHLATRSGPKLTFKQVRHVSKKIAWAENLRKSFGDVVLFADAGFQIRGGERVGIVGANGSGKTTLINMLIGKDQDYSGTLVLGQWVKYSYMGQEILFDDERQTILELILSQRKLSEPDARDHLARFQFYGEDVDKRIEVLSGGERARLYLACVMLEDRDCLILDEPTNHLDMEAREAVEQALQAFQGTIIAVTHDRQFLTNCCTKILEIDAGTITTYDGNYEVYRNLKAAADMEQELEKIDSKAKQQQVRRSQPPVPAQSADPQALERKIAELEEKAAEMEKSFNAETSVEEYEEYGQLLQKIDTLYSEWGTLVSSNGQEDCHGQDY